MTNATLPPMTDEEKREGYIAEMRMRRDHYPPTSVLHKQYQALINSAERRGMDVHPPFQPWLVK